MSLLHTFFKIIHIEAFSGLADIIMFYQKGIRECRENLIMALKRCEA